MQDNLPPGVSTNMIPGNRPVDDWLEAAEEKLMDALIEEACSPDEYEIVKQVGLAAVKAHRKIMKEVVQDVRADEGLYIEHLKDKIIEFGGDPEN